ncbi:MAG: hypothetical protein ACKOT0_05025, partial [bacterium]
MVEGLQRGEGVLAPLRGVPVRPLLDDLQADAESRGEPPRGVDIGSARPGDPVPCARVPVDRQPLGPRREGEVPGVPAPAQSEGDIPAGGGALGDANPLAHQGVARDAGVARGPGEGVVGQALQGIEAEVRGTAAAGRRVIAEDLARGEHRGHCCPVHCDPRSQGTQSRPGGAWVPPA